MLQKLPVNNFKWIKHTSQFNEDFIKNYHEENDEGYFLEVDVQYIEKLHEIHDDFSFLPQTMKIDKSWKDCIANSHDKTEPVIHRRNLKQALNHGLVSKEVYIVNKFNENTWLKPYMNTDLRKKKRKNHFGKDIFKLLNNTDFAKSMENFRKDRDIKFVATERRRNYLVSEPRYHTATVVTE